MAVRENPYEKWQSEGQNSDYRANNTQVNSLVRQQLSQPEYLRDSNRVNPGPYKIKRAKIADSNSQIPHVFGPEDMWGWQPWAEPGSNPTIDPITGLKEKVSPIDIPGATYYPYNKVGGATYVEMDPDAPV